MLKNRKGSALINVLLAAGFMTVSATAVMKILLQYNRSQSEALFKSQVHEIRQSLTSAIASDSAWTVTRSRNTGMICATKTQLYCQPGGSQRKDFALYDAEGVLIFDSTNPAAGFRFDGTPCTTFSRSGNDLCPLRVNLKWRSACMVTGCEGAEDFVTVLFEFFPASNDKKYPFNPANFNQVEVGRRSLQVSESPILACSRIGKVFIGYEQSYNGLSADAGGCVGYQAFRGPAGAQGPRGRDGSMGPTGPAGRDAVCP